MHRRTFVATTGVAVTGAIAGCLNNDSNDDNSNDQNGNDGSNPDRIPQLTGHAVSDTAPTPTVERDGSTDAWGLHIASRDAVNAYYGDIDDEDVQAFIEDTDFEGGDRLLYVQAYGRQTCYELQLADEPQDSQDGETTIDTEVVRTADENMACGEAITPVKLLLRLSFEFDSRSVDTVEVNITGHRGETERLTLDARRDVEDRTHSDS